MAIPEASSRPFRTVPTIFQHSQKPFRSFPMISDPLEEAFPSPPAFQNAPEKLFRTSQPSDRRWFTEVVRVCGAMAGVRNYSKDCPSALRGTGERAIPPRKCSGPFKLNSWASWPAVSKRWSTAAPGGERWTARVVPCGSCRSIPAARNPKRSSSRPRGPRDRRRERMRLRFRFRAQIGRGVDHLPFPFEQFRRWFDGNAFAAASLGITVLINPGGVYPALRSRGISTG